MTPQVQDNQEKKQREMWLLIRRALLMICSAIEKRYDLPAEKRLPDSK